MIEVILETTALSAWTPMPVTQPSSFSASGEVALEGLLDLESLPEGILEDATFPNWRVTREIFERLCFSQNWRKLIQSVS